jgi:hypothetical protein
VVQAPDASQTLYSAVLTTLVVGLYNSMNSARFPEVGLKRISENTTLSPAGLAFTTQERALKTRRILPNMVVFANEDAQSLGIVHFDSKVLRAPVRFVLQIF